MKKVAFAALLTVTAVSVVLLALRVANMFQAPRVGQLNAATCTKIGETHQVIIQDNVLSPAETQAKRCDTLTIINNDPKLRVIAFGPHNAHQTYDGVTEQKLAESQSLTVTLVQTGTFTFHDHLNDQIHGSFTITR